MKLRVCGLLAAMAAAILCLGLGRAVAQNAYITNTATQNISVLNTVTNKVTAMIPWGGGPFFGVVVSPIGGKVYFGKENGITAVNTTTNTEIDTLQLDGTPPTNLVITPDGSTLFTTSFDGQDGILLAVNTTTTPISLIATVDLGLEAFPAGLAITPDGSTVYAAFDVLHSCGSFFAIDTATLSVKNLNGCNGMFPTAPWGMAVTPDGTTLFLGGYVEGPGGGNEVAVIDTATNTTLTTIPIAGDAFGMSGLTVTPDGTKLYVATTEISNADIPSGVVYVVDVGTDTVISTIPFPNFEPVSMAVNPEGSSVYVVNYYNDNVAVIDTATDTPRRALIPVGGWPEAAGNNFIIRPTFAGTPGVPTCRGQTVRALVTRFGSFDAAATSLGFYNVAGLRRSVREFCGGSG